MHRAINKRVGAEQWPYGRQGERGMAIDTVTTNTLRNALQNEDAQPGQTLSCSIGVMAYNEERNIGRLLTALLAQQTSKCQIDEILVLASGCTDSTVDIVSGYCLTDPGSSSS